MFIRQRATMQFKIFICEVTDKILQVKEELKKLSHIVEPRHVISNNVAFYQV